jgi:hypothetical protein
MANPMLNKQMKTELMRKRIWDLYLTGEFKEWEIAAQLGTSQQLVSYHLRICLRGFQQNNFTQAGYWLAREIEKCNYGEAQSWKIYEAAEKGWNRSIGKSKVTSQRARPEKLYDQDGRPIIENGKQKLGMSSIELNVREEDLAGDPRFLKVMLDAQNEIREWQARRAKLLGLEAVKKPAIPVASTSEIESMTDAQLMEVVKNGVKADERMLRELKEALMLTDGSGKNGNGNNGHTVN